MTEGWYWLAFWAAYGFIAGMCLAPAIETLWIWRF